MLYTANRGESLGMQKTHACDEDRSVGFDSGLLVAAAGTYRGLPIGVDEPGLPALKAVLNPSSLMLRRTCFKGVCYSHTTYYLQLHLF